MSGIAAISKGGLHIAAGKPKALSPYFVPTILGNMPAGTLYQYCLHRSIDVK
jgi:hypothetical protein